MSTSEASVGQGVREWLGSAFAAGGLAIAIFTNKSQFPAAVVTIGVDALVVFAAACFARCVQISWPFYSGLGWRVRGRPVARDVTPEELLQARNLISEVMRRYCVGRLKALSEEGPVFELPLVLRPSVVDDRARLVMGMPAPADRAVPAGYAIQSVFAEVGPRLLILGDQGSGKTTLLCQLAEALLEAAGSDGSKPVPVVFQLSRWAVRRGPLDMWLIDELDACNIPRDVAERWIASPRIVPLLDGLDNVTLVYREECADAINEFVDKHRQASVVVSCQPSEYGPRMTLRFSGAAEIGPLSEATVREYLRTAGPELSGVAAAVESDTQLRQLLRTPLFLRIAARDYRNNVKPPGGSISPAQLRQRMISDFVDKTLSDSSSPFTGHQVNRWLGWLASVLVSRDQTEFDIDSLDPSWLPTVGERRKVRLLATFVLMIAAALTGLLFAAVSILPSLILGRRIGFTGAFFGQSVVLVVPDDADKALEIGLIVGLIYGLWLAWGALPAKPEAGSSAALEWSWSTFAKSFVVLLPGVALLWIVFGFLDMAAGPANTWLEYVAAGLVLVIVARLADVDWLWTMLLAFAAVVVINASRQSLGIESGQLILLVIFAITALELSAILGFRRSRSPKAPVPGSAIRAAGRNALKSGLLFGGGVGLLIGIGTAAGAIVWYISTGFLPTYGVLTALSRAGLAALIFGITAGLYAGGALFIQHWILRWQLHRAGRAPLNYVSFLEYASGMFLKRRGSEYEFSHDLFLQHFAAIGSGSETVAGAPGTP